MVLKPVGSSSLHCITVLLSEKYLHLDEEESIPLHRYMTAMKKKYPHIKHIFLSTETRSIIDTLSR
jgi:hypothetical protein